MDLTGLWHVVVVQGEIDILNKELESFRRKEMRTRKEIESLELQKDQERKAHQVRGRRR